MANSDNNHMSGHINDPPIEKLYSPLYVQVRSGENLDVNDNVPLAFSELDAVIRPHGESKTELAARAVNGLIIYATEQAASKVEDWPKLASEARIMIESIIRFADLDSVTPGHVFLEEFDAQIENAREFPKDIDGMAPEMKEYGIRGLAWYAREIISASGLDCENQVSKVQMMMTRLADRWEFLRTLCEQLNAAISAELDMYRAYERAASIGHTNDAPISPAQAALYEPDASEEGRIAELRQELMDRLDKNLMDYFDSIRHLDSRAIPDRSSEIAAMASAHHYLTIMHGFRASELEYLLKFESPLEVVGDEFLYESEIESHSDVMLYIFDEQEALKGGYALVSDTAANDLPVPDPFADSSLKTELFSRLDTNLSDYCESLMRVDKREIIGMAEEIAKYYTAREYLKSVYDYKTGEVEYLIRFQDPLALIADRWPDMLDGSADIRRVVSEILEDRSYHGYYALITDPPSPGTKESARNAADMEKPSVLEQIRAAEREKRERPPAHKDKTKHKHHGEEL